MDSFAVVLVVLLGAQDVLATGYIELEFVRYENQDYSRFDGTCCESETSSCRYDCKNIFDICLSNSTSLPPCYYGSYQSEVITSDKILFDGNSYDPNLAVPYKFQFHRWQGNLSLKVNVNLANQGGLIARLKQFTSIRQPSLWNTSTSTPLQLSWVPKRGRGRSKLLDLKYKIECDEGYLLPDCYKKYCIPQNNIHGGYNCTDRGEKVCLNGWSGSDCTIVTSSTRMISPMPSSSYNAKKISSSSGEITSSGFVMNTYPTTSTIFPSRYSKLQYKSSFVSPSPLVSSSSSKLLHPSSVTIAALSATKVIIKSVPAESNSWMVIEPTTLSPTILTTTSINKKHPSITIATTSIQATSEINLTDITTLVMYLPTTTTLATTQTTFSSTTTLATKQTTLSTTTTLTTTQTTFLSTTLSRPVKYVLSVSLGLLAVVLATGVLTYFIKRKSREKVHPQELEIENMSNSSDAKLKIDDDLHHDIRDANMTTNLTTSKKNTCEKW